MTDTAQVQLGDKVRDRITGFEGIVVGMTEWLYNCRRPIVQPSTVDKDGEPGKPQSFDEPQLEILQREAFMPQQPVQASETRELVGAGRPGGPQDTPGARTTPSRYSAAPAQR